jgi:hypothetical protein
MSAAELRKAAETLRELAGAATSGEWCALPGASNVWHFPETGDGRPVVVAPGNGSQGHHVRQEDAAYIAIVHPGVGLALADWLDTAGADLWAHGPLCECGSGCNDCDDSLWEPHVRRALTLARLINGGTS